MKKNSKRLIVMLLTLAMLASVLALPVLAAPTETKAAFVNTSKNGLDQISLSEPRSFTATIPVDGNFDPATVVWKLVRDETKQYVDPEQYPFQTKGGVLADWTQSDGETALFENIKSTKNASGELELTFDATCYFGEDLSVPHSSGGAYLDVCGYFDLVAETANGTKLGSVALKIAPYDDFHTMAEIYSELDAIEAYAKSSTDLYVKRFSMGKSSGDIDEPLDMPYMIIADKESTVTDWLKFTEYAETNPTAALKDIKAGEYNDIRVPVMYSNIHANETAAADGVMTFAWMLVNEGHDKDGIDYNTLTGFTEAGEAELKAEMTEKGVAVPELVADSATYLGYLTDGNVMQSYYGESSYSGKVDLDKYYEQETETVELDELLEDVFFILVPEENVEGRTYVNRAASNGYDLNRDNSFQTTEETQNMQKLIATFNPVSFTEFHGMVEAFQCEPCDPPHEPNFEYDLLAEHLMTGGEALGIAAVANNERHNSYVIPQRDYLAANEDGTTYWADPWDDMSTSYTPQFAMLQGTVAYTVELPSYTDAAAALVKYGCLGQADYVADEKLDYIEAQVKIYERGVTNFNSNAYDLVGQWFCDQNDVEGAESELFRPVFDGEGENGNFYPECYIIPLDSDNQSNLQAAADMLEWLTRNDVKAYITEKGFIYDGAAYPAGTIVISMYQAKRSVANGALYDGTLIENWTVLYSEGITTFSETRGFDMATVTEPAAYEMIKVACGDAMDYEDALKYLATFGSAFSGVTGDQVIISNASEDSTSAVNALLQQGRKVGMVTDAKSKYYGDFICSYDSWLKVSKAYVITGTGIAAADIPAANVITEAPVLYINGAAADNTSGYIHSNRVSRAASWNYDRCAAELMNFATTSDISKANIIIGASRIDAAAMTAIKAGTPYIGYSSALSRDYASLFGDKLVRSAASGMDCLGYVTYPTTSLVNASYVVDGDDVLYGYGVGYFSAIPEGAKILVQMDGDKTPTEGFIRGITEDDKAASAAYLDDSIQAISYKGEDVDGNDIDVVLFANTLTHKVHQQDEYAYISNFAFSSLLGGAYKAAVETPFKDVKEDDWFYSDVAEVYAAKYMNGTSADTFSPADSVDRGMVVTVLYRLAGTPEVTGKNEFTDVAAGQYYTDAVKWASDKNITLGYGDGTFKPEQSVTRQELVTFIYRYVQSVGKGFTGTWAFPLTFTDKDEIEAWAVEAVTWCNMKDIVKGRTDNSFDPNGTAQRCELAAIINRTVAALAD